MDIMKTADGQPIKNQQKLYWINKETDEIETFNRFELVINVKEDVVTKANQHFFDVKFLDYPCRAFYASYTECEKDFIAYFEIMIEHADREIAFQEKWKQHRQRRLRQIKERNSPYLKPSSDKKPEKVGNCRI